MSRKNLEALDPQQFSSVLLLADTTDSTSVTDADSRNLATLLLLRDIQAQALRASCAGTGGAGGGRSSSPIVEPDASQTHVRV